MVDTVENPIEIEWVDWHYYITVNCEGQSFEVDSAFNNCLSEKWIDIVYKFEVYSRHVRIHIDLFDEDKFTRPDLADISSHPGGGMDNYEEITRGTRFSAVYDTRNNILIDNDMVTEKLGYLITSGAYDGSSDVDENDAELWFGVCDDYEIPKAEAGPDRFCHTGMNVFFDGTVSTASNASHIVKYEWDFDGDGEFEVKEAQPSYTFNTKGQFDVRLRVWDSYGETDVDECKVFVGDSPPYSFFTFHPDNPTLLSLIQFYDNSSNNDGYIKKLGIETSVTEISQPYRTRPMSLPKRGHIP